MPVILDATVGGATSNSYPTRAEADTYFEMRVALVPAWTSFTNEQKDVLLMMATRQMDALLLGKRRLVYGSKPPYYVIDMKWTGSPATTTQKLAWPRVGMYDQNGNAIASDVIPQTLKDATAEFAGQLGKTDSTLNNDVIVQGLTSVRAGSVALTFKESGFLAQVMPDAVMGLLVPSWYTEMQYDAAEASFFDVVSE